MKPDRRTAITTVLAGGMTLGFGELSATGKQEEVQSDSTNEQDFDQMALS